MKKTNSELRNYDIINFDNFEFNKVYNTPRGEVEIITSSYYGDKTFYIIMLDGQQVSTHRTATRAIDAVKRMLSNYNKKAFWL